MCTRTELFGCELSVLNDRTDVSLPGAKKGDFSSRRTRLAVRSKCVRFSPTGLQFAAASTEVSGAVTSTLLILREQGLLVYSLDSALAFDPSELGALPSDLLNVPDCNRVRADMEITPANTEVALKKKQLGKALLVHLQPSLRHALTPSVSGADGAELERDQAD